MRAAAVSIVCLAAVARVQAQGPSLTIIEPTPGQPRSHITGLSGNGLAASGYSAVGGSATPQPGFHWTRADGRNDFGLVLGQPTNTPSTAISGDGLFVAGLAFNVGSADPTQIYRWSQAGGYQNIGTIPGWRFSQARAMNGDGSVLVGYVHNMAGTSASAFRWVSGAGFQDLGYLRPGSSLAQSVGVSRDGNVVVGISAPSVFGPIEAFRWTPQTGMVPVAPAIGSPFDETTARGVSGDGSVIVGYGNSPGTPSRPWRWTEETGIEDLGLPSDATTGLLTLANYNGSVAVGSMNFPGNQGVPYLWNENSGFTPLLDYFSDNGVVFPTGYSFFDVAGISDDGLTFGGVCASTDGTLPTRGWVATVPAPAPLCILLSALAYTRRSRPVIAIPR